MWGPLVAAPSTANQHDQFKQLILEYLQQGLKIVEPETFGALELIDWVVKNQKAVGVALPEIPKYRRPTKSRASNDAARLKYIGERVEQDLQAIQTSEVKTLPFFDNLEFFRQKAGLDTEDAKLLTFYAVEKRGKFFEKLYPALIQDKGEDEDGYFKVVSELTGIPAQQAKQKIVKLVQYGLLDLGYNTSISLKYRDPLGSGAFTINDKFSEALLSHQDKDAMLDSLIGKRAKSKLTFKKFSYMEREGRHLIESVRGAVADPSSEGRNFGAYGGWGVGKTEFMGVMAQELGLPVYFVGMIKESENANPLSITFKEPKRSDSLGDLLRASFLVEKLGIKAVLVKDEGEGILKLSDNADSEDSANKSLITYFLDHNKVPTIYITNEMNTLDGAIRTRLVSWTHFDTPPVTARISIMKDQLEEFKLQVDDEFVRLLADNFPTVNPRVTGRILRGIAWRGDLKDAPREEVQKIILEQFQHQWKALNGGVNIPILPRKTEADVKPVLWSPDVNLDRLTARLEQAKNFLLITTGPYGTGKKTFAYDLARRMGKRMHEKTGDDITFGDPSSFVPFSKLLTVANSENGFILLSTQDHLGAGAPVLDHYFRVMEETKVPIVITVTAPPGMARFSNDLAGAAFETVNFDYLNPEKNMLAYYHFFNREPPPVMQTFKTLTPIKLAQLKTVMDQSGVKFSDDEIVERLHRQVRELKGIETIPLSSVIGYMASENEVNNLTVGWKDGREAMLQRHLIALTLDDRYKLLEKIPKKERVDWDNIAHLLDRPATRIEVTAPRLIQ